MSRKNIRREKLCDFKLCKNYKLRNEKLCRIHNKKPKSYFKNIYMFLLVTLLITGIVLTYSNKHLNIQEYIQEYDETYVIIKQVHNQSVNYIKAVSYNFLYYISNTIEKMIELIDVDIMTLQMLEEI